MYLEGSTGRVLYPVPSTEGVSFVFQSFSYSLSLFYVLSSATITIGVKSSPKGGDNDIGNYYVVVQEGCCNLGLLYVPLP